MEFFTTNWVELLLAAITFLGTYTALTETTKDDKLLDIVRRILNAVILGRNR
jgi:hypothetical protein|tara:strand:+ start:1140 stop:1295 length:156 start_codon:yes stop_codon:yes gene_type:complete